MRSSDKVTATVARFAKSWGTVWRAKSFSNRASSELSPETDGRSGELHEPAVVKLALGEGVDDRGHHHAGHTERCFAQDDGQQDFPGLRIDMLADDPRTQDVLQLVGDDQKDQRGHCRPHRHAEREDYDDGVRYEISQQRYK